MVAALSKVRFRFTRCGRLSESPCLLDMPYVSLTFPLPEGYSLLSSSHIYYSRASVPQPFDFFCRFAELKIRHGIEDEKPSTQSSGTQRMASELICMEVLVLSEQPF